VELKKSAHLCQIARPSHQAELVPGTNKDFLNANHSGATVSCAEHSGLCHDVCWPQALYPDLHERIAARA
jgi:hypothetical protein